MSYTKKISALHHQVGTHHQLDGAGPLFLPRPCARRQVRADAAVFGYSERILGITSAVGVIWFVEPISYFPIVGVAGTYMAFVSGNISNLRIPCAMIAQKAAMSSSSPRVSSRARRCSSSCPRSSSMPSNCCCRPCLARLSKVPGKAGGLKRGNRSTRFLLFAYGELQQLKLLHLPVFFFLVPYVEPNFPFSYSYRAYKISSRPETRSCYFTNLFKEFRYLNSAFPFK